MALGGQEEVGECRRKCGLREQNGLQCPSLLGSGSSRPGRRAGEGMRRHEHFAQPAGAIISHRSPLEQAT